MKNSGWMNERNRSFHFFREYKVLTPKSNTLAIVKTQVIKMGSKEFFSGHLIFNPGEAPVGDDYASLFSPIFPPLLGTDLRIKFDGQIDTFQTKGNYNLGWEFGTKYFDVFWNNFGYNFEQVKDVFANRVTAKENYYLGPMTTPSVVQQMLLIPFPDQSLVWPEKTQ